MLIPSIVRRVGFNSLFALLLIVEFGCLSQAELVEHERQRWVAYGECLRSHRFHEIVSGEVRKAAFSRRIILGMRLSHVTTMFACAYPNLATNYQFAGLCNRVMIKSDLSTIETFDICCWACSRYMFGDERSVDALTFVDGVLVQVLDY